MKTYNFLKADKNYIKGEIILNLGRKKCDKSDPARLQIDENLFIKPPFLIRHDCNPNSFIDWKNNQLKALRDIDNAEFVTYHYGTSEDDYSVGKFDCTCGSDDCIKRFSGCKDMDNIQRETIKERVSPFLKNKYF